MKKIACICSFEPSSWVSCQKIVQNLLSSYQALPEVEIARFNYHHELTDHEVMELADNLHAAQPDVVVILDHKPHPLKLFNYYLAANRAGPKCPPIVVHVFGDFTLYYKEWNKLEKHLKGKDVRFVTASDRQKHLIDKFVPQPSAVVPFPVDGKEFFFSQDERRQQRALWGVSDKEMVFTFTGRLSRQKRIHTLLETFSNFLEESKSPAHLFLYGIADHVADPFMEKWEIEGEYFRKIHRVYSALPESSRARIHFMGGVPNSELRAVYNGADYLVNLSVHNDEDYGMSVAEAICTGLPAILTDWGGLASFGSEKFPDATRFIPVQIGKRGKLVSKEVTLSLLKEAKPFAQRKELSLDSLTRFGIQGSKDCVKKILAGAPQVFTEFSPLFKEAAQKVEFGPNVYLTKTKIISPLYRKIYSSYVRPT